MASSVFSQTKTLDSDAHSANACYRNADEQYGFEFTICPEAEDEFDRVITPG